MILLSSNTYSLKSMCYCLTKSNTYSLKNWKTQKRMKKIRSITHDPPPTGMDVLISSRFLSLRNVSNSTNCTGVLWRLSERMYILASIPEVLATFLYHKLSTILYVSFMCFCFHLQHHFMNSFSCQLFFKNYIFSDCTFHSI